MQAFGFFKLVLAGTSLINRKWVYCKLAFRKTSADSGMLHDEIGRGDLNGKLVHKISGFEASKNTIY
jgi:hypothetical protein